MTYKVRKWDGRQWEGQDLSSPPLSTDTSLTGQYQTFPAADLFSLGSLDMLGGYQWLTADEIKLLREAKQGLKSKLPTLVYFNDKKRATTLKFEDSVVVVRAGEGDDYKRRIGFLEAYFQATCGLSKTKAKKYLENIVEVDKDERGNKNTKRDSGLPKQK